MTTRHPFIRPIWAAWFYLVCFVLMPAILMLNLSSQVSGIVSALLPGVDVTYPSTLLCKPGNCPQRIAQTNGFVKGQYDNAAKEIHERLRFEHLLFVLKFTAGGVIIAFVGRVIDTQQIPRQNGSRQHGLMKGR
jgi:hypothetical protein